jgi:putative hydrolase of the HAD superfamily
MKQVPEGVQNIIFDLGGVLLDIDPDRSIEAFKALGLTDVIKPGGWGYKHEVFLNMEEGLLTDDEFRDGVRKLLPQEVTDHDIDTAWCAMLIDFPVDRIALLKELQADYQLYLFSNTNNIHLQYFHHLFQQKFGYSITELFEKDFYSHVIQKRKPSLESFQIVLNNAGLSPRETLFIDDSKDNVEGAQKVGMHAVHLTSEKSLHKIFATD